MKNPKLSNRTRITVAVILLIAVIGLVAVKTDPVTADRAGEPVLTHQVPYHYTPETRSEGEMPSFLNSTMPSLLKLSAALFVVLVSIYVGIFLLKKMMGKRYTGNGTYNALEVLETTYVAPKKTVSLLRVADKSVLIGVSDNQISILTELDSETTRKILTASHSETQEDKFQVILRSAAQRLKGLAFKGTDSTPAQSGVGAKSTRYHAEQELCRRHGSC